MAAARRKMRGFKKWMKCQGIEYSNSLVFGDDDPTFSISMISVKTLCDLTEGDVVATIPKESCLTVMTSAASQLIEEAELGGYLGLAVALMYEKSLGTKSKWFDYLQILPPFEPIPLLWSLSELDSLLSGTELHKTVKEDKDIVCQDWKECIQPLLDMPSFELNPDFFTVDEYFAAKSLIASRSFQIDDYHGVGMVPLADLFNHKTAAEDVHFTSISSGSDSDTESDDNDEDGNKDADDENDGDDSHSESGGSSGSEMELSSSSDTTFMQMIMVKDVKAGAEVFNTYGYVGNAALLHRYGFTEPDNPFDILNIDLDIVVQWSLSLFSCRRSRRRLSLWRKLDYSESSTSQDSEYFEISLDGEPQIELLVLLYIMLLPDNDYNELDVAAQASGKGEVTKKNPSFRLLDKEKFLSTEELESSKKLLLTASVGQALISLADARESCYGPSTLEDDIRSFNDSSHCATDNVKLRHSLMLRISERRIIGKLRSFAAASAGVSKSDEGSRSRKRSERD